MELSRLSDEGVNLPLEPAQDEADVTFVRHQSETLTIKPMIWVLANPLSMIAPIPEASALLPNRATEEAPADASIRVVVTYVAG